MQIHQIPQLRKPVAILAFNGWNDAGESASGALSHLLSSWKNSLSAITDPEDYYDFQVNRPQIRVDDKVIREIIWPNTAVYTQGAWSAPKEDGGQVKITGTMPPLGAPTDF